MLPYLACNILYLNLPPITIDDRPRLDKRSHYTPNLLPNSISVASKNSDSTLNTPYDSLQLLILNFDDPNPRHAKNKYYLSVTE